MLLFSCNSCAWKYHWCIIFFSVDFCDTIGSKYSFSLELNVQYYTSSGNVILRIIKKCYEITFEFPTGYQRVIQLFAYCS